MGTRIITLTLTLTLAATGIGGPGTSAAAESCPSGHVALTFDDGPVSAGTGAVLDALRVRGVQVTFFVVGSRAAADPGWSPRGRRGARHRQPHLEPRAADEAVRRRHRLHAPADERPTRLHGHPPADAGAAPLRRAQRPGRRGHPQPGLDPAAVERRPPGLAGRLAAGDRLLRAWPAPPRRRDPPPRRDPPVRDHRRGAAGDHRRRAARRQADDRRRGARRRSGRGVAGLPAVERLAGGERTATAAAAATRARELGLAGPPLLVSAERFPDGLAAGVLAGAVLRAPLLSTRRDELSPPVYPWLASYGTGALTVVGGPVAVSPRVRCQIVTGFQYSFLCP